MQMKRQALGQHLARQPSLSSGWLVTRRVSGRAPDLLRSSIDLGRKGMQDEGSRR